MLEQHCLSLKSPKVKNVHFAHKLFLILDEGFFGYHGDRQSVGLCILGILDTAIFGNNA